MKVKSIKQIFDQKLYSKQREIFNRWKSNSSLLEVIRFQNEEGPVRLDVEKTRQEIANLKAMIKDKMILNDHEIIDVLDQNEQDYLDKVRKVFGRAKAHKDGFEWLKPYCLDKWKKYV